MFSLLLLDYYPVMKRITNDGMTANTQSWSITIETNVPWFINLIPNYDCCFVMNIVRMR